MLQQDKVVKLLESLVKIPSLSGYEQKIAKFIQKELLKYLPKTRVHIDRHNNVIGIIKGTSDKVVMLDAHLDQVGFIINNIDKEGYVSIDEIGGVDEDIVQARPVIIQSYTGKIINGVIDKKPVHYLNGETSRADKHTDEEVNLDIGIKKIKNVSKFLKVGDPLMFKPEFGHLMNHYYYGYGFDDKIGCLMLLELARELKKTKPYATIILSFSAQEEVGKTTARISVNKYKPDAFIELDVTTATDIGMPDFEREAGRCELDKGIVVYRGVGIDHYILQALEGTAQASKVKTQVQASNGNVGYISEEIESLNLGIRIATIGIPLRNMHTPVEVLNMTDVYGGIKLLKGLLISKRFATALRKDI